MPQPAAAGAAQPAAAKPDAAPAGEGQSESKAEAPPKPKPVAPTLVAHINLSSQTMTVREGDRIVHSWKISSGRSGYLTPAGSFRPTWVSRMHYSKQYDDAPMPHSVFFNGGIAVHGTYSTGMLGRPASHGCVRLAPGNAGQFYRLVGRHGLGRTRIIVHGKTPATRSTRIAREDGSSRRGYGGYGYYDGRPPWIARSGYGYPGDYGSRRGSWWGW
jgi:hypothetical protein